MKKVMAWILVCVMLLSLTACGKEEAQAPGGSSSDAKTVKTETKKADKEEKAKKPAKGMETFTLKTEMEDAGIMLEATMGYPKKAGITVEDESSDSYRVLADKEDGYEISIYLTYDSTTYDDNQEYAKQEAHYEQRQFGGFEGYAAQLFESSFDVSIYLDYLEYEDVYVYASICNHMDVDWDNRRDVYELYQLEEVQEILNSVVYTPQGEARPAPEEREGGFVFEDSDEADASYDWWEKEWYGWWAIKNGTGIYKEPSDLNLVWDTFAEIDVYNDNTGRVTIWDTGTTKDEPLIIGYEVVYEPGWSEKGCLASDRVVFFPEGKWNNGMAADTMEEREDGWVIDPADSTVSHFEDMLEFTGHYVSPENPDDSFDYYVYLRPWGMLWDDVKNGDTSGCLYKDMMPLYYDNYYLSLLNLGYEHPLSSFTEGIQVIEDAIANANAGGNTAAALNPADKEGADGKVPMAVLKECLPWCKKETSYDTTYDEIAARFGVHGLAVDSLFENIAIYKWLADDDNYIQISFNIHEDGSETWNITQWQGIE